MNRSIMNDLVSWKNSHRRKPLVLMGARQVGKTWILKEFGKTFEQCIYINFDKDNDYAELFERTKDVKRIIEQLSIVSGVPINNNTFLILDEIQECQAALGALKYFCEELPDIYVAAAGSLLGLSLGKGFPVGKVNILSMYPMTLCEYLSAADCGNLISYIKSIDNIDAIPQLVINQLEEKARVYYMTGGMPEVVDSWIKYNDIKEVNDIQQELLISYEKDMGKYPDNSDIPKIHYIWDSVVSQLSRENKKFLYSVVKTGARAREYESALNWLVNARLLDKVYNVKKPDLPLSSYYDLSSFKIYMNDVGLLRCKCGIEKAIGMDGLFNEFSGAFAENYVYQSLVANGFEVSYWKDAKHEMDFLIQYNGEMYPIEVKSGSNIKSASMKAFGEKFNPRVMIRTSMLNLSFDGRVLNIPLYLIDFIKQFIDLIG